MRQEQRLHSCHTRMILLTWKGLDSDLRKPGPGMLLRGKRQVLHARVATVLEQKFPDLVERQPELLAHHLTAAGETETESLRRSAVHYLTLAGEQAMGLDSIHAEDVLQDARSLATTGDSELVRTSALSVRSGAPKGTWPLPKRMWPRRARSCATMRPSPRCSSAPYRRD